MDRYGIKEKVWERAGVDLGMDWVHAGVFVGMAQFQRYEFVGTKGPGYQGDIAVDDVNFGQCSPCELQATASLNPKIPH